MGVWSFSQRNGGGGQRRPGSPVDREAGKGLAFKDDREGDLFIQSGLPVERPPPTDAAWRAAGPPCFSGEADRGVSTVAFKLTKSNISQIRLWLFLREPERRVMGGGSEDN